MRTYWGLAAAPAIAFALAVMLFAGTGGAATEGLDRACAEAAYVSGKKMEDRGNLEAATRFYRQALTGRFQDQELEWLCARTLGELLYRQGRYGEAADVFGDLPPEAFTAAGTLTAYVKALHENGSLAKAAEWGGRWLERAQAEENVEQQVWAAQQLGTIKLEQGHPEEALAFYRRAVQVEPASNAHVNAALILHGQGRHAEALEHLDQFLSHVDSGKSYRDAIALKEKVTAAL